MLDLKNAQHGSKSQVLSQWSMQWNVSTCDLRRRLLLICQLILQKNILINENMARLIHLNKWNSYTLMSAFKYRPCSIGGERSLFWFCWNLRGFWRIHFPLCSTLWGSPCSKRYKHTGDGPRSAVTSSSRWTKAGEEWKDVNCDYHVTAPISRRLTSKRYDDTGCCFELGRAKRRSSSVDFGDRTLQRCIGALCCLLYVLHLKFSPFKSRIKCGYSNFFFHFNTFIQV